MQRVLGFILMHNVAEIADTSFKPGEVLGRRCEMLGIGAMLGAMTDNSQSVMAFKGALGKTIAAVSLGDDDALHIKFTDGYAIKFADEGQSCCESRYMRTDDDLQSFIGSQLIDAELKEAPDAKGDDEWGEHDVQFLEVRTSTGVFTMASHNEHNGYYGGFHIVVSLDGEPS